ESEPDTYGLDGVRVEVVQDRDGLFPAVPDRTQLSAKRFEADALPVHFVLRRRGYPYCLVVAVTAGLERQRSSGAARKAQVRKRHFVCFTDDLEVGCGRESQAKTKNEK